MTEKVSITWLEAGKNQTANWQSVANNPSPKRITVINDTIKADAAYKLACEGSAMLWRGDFQNAKHLSQAISRRIDNRTTKPKAIKQAGKIERTPKDQFHLYRKNQIERARTLGMLLVELSPDYNLPYARAPEVKAACEHAYGMQKDKENIVVSLRELLGVMGAYEWHKKGVEISQLGASVTPYYGVYSPVRGEYIELVAHAPLNNVSVAFDIGTGTGVLAALLAKRGVKKVIATEQEPRALLCATENIAKLGFATQVKVLNANLFPPADAGLADLIVCNPPWLPAKANSPIDHAIYDNNSAMLKGFLAGLKTHLAIKGEGWLILSDLAEHLGLRTRDELHAWIAAAQLEVIEKIDTKPLHAKSQDKTDALFAARSKEITSLWRLKVAKIKASNG
ncbi:MAG: methyltransferase [Methylophilaceae bacterium]